MTMNKILVIGNLGRDPEMRYTPSGQAVTNFTVATNRKYTTAEGESREETEWFRVSAWGRLAETCNQYLTKGQKIYVEGRLRSRSYETRDGQTRFENEISASDVRFLDRPGSRGEEFPPEGEQVMESGTEPDDLPF
jgi:single-strand DNA-binding protein